MNNRSKQLRRDTAELMLANGGYHWGGSFSCIEILIALYDHILGSDDTFILSKGHACWPYYVILREMGFDPKLFGHPTMDIHNGVPCSTGSLGHGLPISVGMAIAQRIVSPLSDPPRVFCLMGDGECQEGTTWESMLIAAKYQLDNLIVIVDWNQIQGSGFVKEILPIENLGRMAQDIGWVTALCDGHIMEDIVNEIVSIQHVKKPLLIIAHTVKGKGVSFMEGKPEWHAKWPSADELKLMAKELK